MRKIPVVIGMVAVTGILYACGGSGSKSSSDNNGGTITTVTAPPIASATTISNPTEAARTVNSSRALASSFASGSAFPSLNSLVSKPAADQTANGHRILDTIRDVQKRALALQEIPKKVGKYAAAPTTDTYPCAVSGSRTIVYDDVSGNMSITATSCKEDYELTNGTMSLTGISQGNSSGGSIAVNMSTINYAYGGYVTKEHESMMNLTMTINSLSNSANSSTSSFSMNGTEKNINYNSGTSEKQAFGNFSLSMSESASGSITTVNMTMSGSVTMDTYRDTTFTAIDTASGMTFQNLKLVDTVNSATMTNSLTIDGTYAIRTIPACMDGTFAISTQSPLVTTSNGVTTGQMTVNGVVMVFNADGSVTASINGVPQTITSYANVCSLSF
jgi:hypothetical protein